MPVPQLPPAGQVPGYVRPGRAAGAIPQSPAAPRPTAPKAPGAGGAGFPTTMPGQVNPTFLPTTQTDPAPQGPPAGGPAQTPTGPATTPAPNAPAPSAPSSGVPAPGSTVPGGGAAPGVQAPAAPIGTPGTAASQPLEDSPWAYEKMWGALGSLGDSELDAMVKSKTMGLMEKDPYSAAALQGADAATFEQGMAGLGGQKQALAADLARRGITGPAAAAMMAEAEAGARADISKNQQANAQSFREKGAEYGLAAAQQGQALASDLAKRGVDIESLRMNREQLARQLQAARAGGGGGDDMLEIVNPDGSVSQVPMNILGMVLDMEEGGMF